MSDEAYSAQPLRQLNRGAKDDYVTILAIYDDPPSFQTQQKTASVRTPSQSPTVIAVEEVSRKRSRADGDGVVEITSLADPPRHGLRVVAEPEQHLPPSDGASSHLLQHQREQSSSSASFRRSPALDGSQRLYQHGSNSDRQSANMSHLSRSHARKSRFTDGFLDAYDRLEERQESAIVQSATADQSVKQMKVVLASETAGTPLGIEISTVPDPNDSRGNRILSVEVRQIDEDGRIAVDGRIKVGDQITEINHRPIYEMSLPKAQARLRDLEHVLEPELIVLRRHTESEKHPEVTRAKPVVTALQMANTTEIGTTTTFTLKKGRTGFGFNVKSRMDAYNQTLIICISSVNVSGPAHNVLRIGDRLLKINGTEVSSHTQAEVVALLKSIPSGGTVEILISRRNDEHDEPDGQLNLTTSEPSTSAENQENKPVEKIDICHKRRQSAFIDTTDDKVEFLTFHIPLVSRSAGLGISLKGGKLYPENGNLENGVDCGVFVKSILHGSPAYLDGRLREDDRLVGIEDQDLRSFYQNADALNAFSKKFADLPINRQTVTIHIARCKTKQAKVSNAAPPALSQAWPTREGYDSDVSLAPDSDAFIRTNPTRKSISEKRPFGSGNDAAHSQTYQKIVHQRQTSAPQIRSTSLDVPSFKKRQASLSISKNRYRMSLAPEPIAIDYPSRTSPDENAHPTKDEYWSALRKLNFPSPKQRQSMYIESFTNRPAASLKGTSSKGQPASVLAPLSQLFSHFKSGGKKDKARRHTVYVAQDDMVIEPLEPSPPLPEATSYAAGNAFASPEDDDEGVKPRSQSHEPLSSNVKTKNKDSPPTAPKVEEKNSETLPSISMRRKKIEPAPSFKMAMSNNTMQPAFTDDLASSELNRDALANLQISMAREKNKRKSTGGGLLRFMHKSYETSPPRFYHEEDRRGPAPPPPRLPPPYEGPHRHAPPPPGAPMNRFPKTIPNQAPYLHQRMYSAQEATMGIYEPDVLLHYEQHRYGGPPDPGAPHIVQYTSNVGLGQGTYHMFHPTSAYVGPSPLQQHQQLSVHQKQLFQQQQRDRELQKLSQQAPYHRHMHSTNGNFAGGSGTSGQSPNDGGGGASNNNYDYYDTFNAWFAHSGRVAATPDNFAAPSGYRGQRHAKQYVAPSPYEFAGEGKAASRSLSAAPHAAPVPGPRPSGVAQLPAPFKPATGRIPSASSAFAQFAPANHGIYLPEDASTFRF